jgi:hypothetical protein
MDTEGHYLHFLKSVIIIIIMTMMMLVIIWTLYQENIL